MTKHVAARYLNEFIIYQPSIPQLQSHTWMMVVILSLFITMAYFFKKKSLYLSHDKMNKSVN